MINHKTPVKDTISGYNKKSTFSSFLPGIAGIKGTPIWCYYVNRGQAVVSFGVSDKDHGIMEFYPAHTAYQMVKRTGFRTFIKADGKYFEPFKKADDSDLMTIYMNGLSIRESSEDMGITTTVDYASLPGEEIGALLRVVTIRNDGGSTRHFEVLDGMPALVPYGVEQYALKMMTQTAKAWMQVEDLESKVPFYRARVSMEDSAVIEKVEGGNFALAITEDGKRLSVIADPGAVFDYDMSFDDANVLISGGLDKVLSTHQNTSNEFPCCFFAEGKELKSGEEMVIYEMIGQVRNKGVLDKFLEKEIDREYFISKFEEADELTDTLTDAVDTKTGNPTFDAYTRVNYMDNVLRGGSPIDLAGHVFYVYSRKHGDLERDYNYFSMSPEFYSQGNGNFRDVNQNRRCDAFFSGIVGSRNIEMFYSLLQLDGYNPLRIEQIRYDCDREVTHGLSVKHPFTPGELFGAINDAGIVNPDERFNEIMKVSHETVNGEFGEGYWSDHWTYNLDLIEDYLDIYPDREKELMNKEVSSFDCKVKVLGRNERYVKTDNGIRQYKFLEKRETNKEGSYAVYADGREVKMSLLAKMILLTAVKFSSIDAYGMGIEMDGGKPGWYDALNGVPGLLGSSVNETYELIRMIDFVTRELNKYDEDITLPGETAQFIKKLYDIEKEFDSTSASDMQFLANWNQRNDAREEYREKVYANLSGGIKALSSSELLEVLDVFEKRLNAGVDRALKIGNGISPSYFTFNVDAYSEKDSCIIPEHFEAVKVPYFLEGVVRFFKLGRSIEDKKQLYKRVKESDLYDDKLGMYKVNASLADSSIELGRCRAFTPGWLENESIWLHMEYKYLLELIRNGLYEEFFEDFKNMAVPFLDKDTYGRSTLENSSFIASSKNPNSSIRGKGFVARLSGSTIEFISMWKEIFFGKNIFRMENGELIFELSPAIPKYLLAKKGEEYTVSATLLGHIKVNYFCDKCADYYPGKFNISEVELIYDDGLQIKVPGSKVIADKAENIRQGRVRTLNIKMTTT